MSERPSSPRPARLAAAVLASAPTPSVGHRLSGLSRAALFAVAALIAACGGPADPGAGGGGGPGGPGGPPTVGVTSPVQRTIPEWDEHTGRLSAVDSVEVRARVTGYVERVHFEEGALVRRGDLLFTLDPRTFRAGVEEAGARRDEQRVRLDLAQRELERIEPLIDLRAVSQEELDRRRQEVESARAALAATEAEVRTVSLDLEFARVTAPISGRVGRAMVTEGNLVTGGSGAATVLTTLVSLDPIWLYFSPDERSALGYLRQQRESADGDGVPVEMQLADETGFPRRGRLDFVDNRIDGQTGTLLVRAVFDNPDGELLPGMFGRVRLQASPPAPRILVPERAIGIDQTQEFVLLVGDDGTVERRAIVTGPSVGDLRIVRDGLSGSDQVIVEGLQMARPGSPVTPRPLESDGGAESAPEAEVEQAGAAAGEGNAS